MDIKQFKLTNGEEIITQVVEWPDDDAVEMVIKNPLKVFSVQTEDNSFYHSFRPWMLYQIDDKNLMLLNMSQIVGEANPHQSVINEYNKTLNYLLKDERKEVTDIEENVTFEDLAEMFFRKGKLH